MFISFMLGDMDMDNYFVKYFYNVENLIVNNNKITVFIFDDA
jgi:hypothetical protein